MKIKIILMALSSLLIVAGCGGGSGGGSVSNATINSSNERSLAVAATEGAKAAIVVSLPTTFGLRSAGRSGIDNFSEQLAARIVAIPEPVLGICTNSGTVIQDIDVNGNGTLVITNCDLGGPIASGIVNISTTQSGGTITIVIGFNNFTITEGAEVQTFDLTSTCVVNTSSPTLNISCSYESSYAGIDGRVYSISGISFSGDDISGYTVSAIVIDPDHGRISVTTTEPVMFNCADSQPSMGQIQFIDDGGVLVTITFNDCTSFTVSYSSNTNVYNW